MSITELDPTELAQPARGRAWELYNSSARPANPFIIERSPTAYADAVWGLYARISEDPDLVDEETGEYVLDEEGNRIKAEDGVTDQVEDDRKAILAKGGTLPTPAHEFIENDTSAYKRKLVEIVDQYGERRKVRRVVRPVWARAMKALRDGEITALMVPNLDRLARDERDFFDAQEAVEDFGRIVVSATQSDIDLSTETGIMMAGMMVKFANKSSRDTARRVARAAEREANKGKAVGGIRPFGFHDDKVTHNEVEAALIRDAARDVINGVPLRVIARRWNAQGVRTSTGREWHPNTVRQVLKGPRVAGWRVHRGRVHVDEEGEPIRGQWKPILDEDTWERVLLVFNDPNRRGRKTARPGARQYLLTGLVRCGRCGGLMYGNGYARHPVENEDRFSYACANSGKVTNSHALSVSGVRLDEHVEKLVLLRLTDEQYEVSGPAFEGDARLATVKAKIAELMAAFEADDMPGDVVFPKVKKLSRERDELVAARKAYITATAGPSLTGITPAKWKKYTPDEKRARIAQLLDAVYIKPTTNRGPKLDLSRVVPVWRGEELPEELELPTGR